MISTQRHLSDVMLCAVAFILCLAGPESHEVQFWTEGVILFAIACAQERIDERNGA